MVQPATKRLVTEAAAKLRYAPSAAGSTQRLMAGLAANLDDQSIMLMGDSRGNARTEWFGILIDSIAAQYPTHTVIWNLWNDTTQGWDAPLTVQTGIGSRTLYAWNASVGGKALDYPAGARLKTWADIQPTLAILALDTNETTSSGNWDQQRDRVLAITEQFQLMSPMTDWILTGGPQDFTEPDANSMYERGKRTRQVAKIKGYGFVDVYKAFVDYGPTYKDDLYDVDAGGLVLQPNAAGSRLWANAFLPSFRYDPNTQPTPQCASALTESVVNIFPDGDLRGYDGTTLNGWVLPAGVTASKDTTNYETKGYGVRFQSSSADTSPYKDIPISQYRGQWVTACVRVFVPAGKGVDVGRPRINDFTSITSGLAYPAAQGSFVWQTVSKRINAAATTLRVTVHLGVASGGDCTVDRVVVVPGILPRDLPSSVYPDVQTFSAGGTWTRPVGAKVVKVVLVSGGGGGGSGRRGADGTTRCGGGGGGGASRIERELPASTITPTVAITVGAGGAGGAAVTTDDTNGNDGGNGGVSTFGAFLRSTLGTKGIGGTNAAGTNGQGGLGVEEGANGGAASSTGGIGVAGANARGAGGAGGGGGIGTGNLANAGGAGGYSLGAGYWNAAAGGVIDTTAPAVGYSQPVGSGLSGNGGGGGASSVTTAAQAGAAGGGYGGGGGGGGASRNGSNSGAGGAGASGVVIVTTYF